MKPAKKKIHLGGSITRENLEPAMIWRNRATFRLKQAGFTVHDPTEGLRNFLLRDTSSQSARISLQAEDHFPGTSVLETRKADLLLVHEPWQIYPSDNFGDWARNGLVWEAYNRDIPVFCTENVKYLLHHGMVSQMVDQVFPDLEAALDWIQQNHSPKLKNSRTGTQNHAKNT